MSARQPFVPSSRPASRAAHLKDTSTPQFTADPGNPLHGMFARNATLDALPQADQEKDPENRGSGSHKPLNLSSFVKKNPPSHSHSEQPGLGPMRREPRKSVDGIMRPGTADILSGSQHVEHKPTRRLSGVPSQGHALKIAAPMPTSSYSSNPSSFLSTDNFTFKAPALPLSSSKLLSSHSSDDQISGGAHIPISIAETHSNLLTADLLLESRLHHSRSFEKMHESSEGAERRDPPGFGINTPGAKEGGPQRVLVAHSGGVPEPSLVRRTNGSKRARAKGFDEDVCEDEYGRQAKRYKFDTQIKDGIPIEEHDRQVEYSAMAAPNQSSRHSTPVSHHSYQSPGTAGPENESDQQHTYLSQEHHDHSASALALSPSKNPSQRPTRRHHRNQLTSFQNQEHRQSVAPESSLSKIFGKDVDTYIDEHLEIYEEAKKRWEGCTMEEWVAGADEICAAFVRVLDFVKDHMTAKVKLYASLDMKLEEHSSALKERDKVLVGARASLVKEGANVLGDA